MMPLFDVTQPPVQYSIPILHPSPYHHLVLYIVLLVDLQE